MKNKWIITSVVLSNITLSLISFKIGYSISKKKHSPKLTAGEIYIDYTEDPKQPAFYLSNINPKIFNNDMKFIILGLNHIRK